MSIDPNPPVSATVLAKFSAVGVLNTALDYGLFALLTWMGWNPAAAHTTSTVVATVNSYLWNHHWTFQVRGSDQWRPIKFVALNLASYGLSLAVLLAASALGAPVLVAKAGALGVTLVVNFLGNRWWVFPPSPLPKDLQGARLDSPERNTTADSSSR